MKIEEISAIIPLIPIDIIAYIVSVVCFFLWLKNIRNLHLKSIEYEKMQQENQSVQIENILLKQRLSDAAAQKDNAEYQNKLYQQELSALEQRLSASSATFQAKEEAMQEKITYLEQLRSDLTLKFKDVSSEILKSQQESFSTAEKNTLSSIITPFAEQLQLFKSEVIATREESIKNKSHMDAQLSQLATLNQNLSKEAKDLTEALRGDKKMQGNWGECQLNRILEISGLRDGIDYDTQSTFYDEQKKMFRPDVIVHLPERRDIIIDSKVSLNDYLQAINTEDAQEKSQAFQRHLSAVKAHIDELSAKDYQKLLKNNSLNYVIMFIPMESAYIAAIEADYTLYDYAYKKNIILATPLSLLPILRTVENLWKVDSQNQNVQKIAELGGKIYDKLAAFIDDMKVLERGISQANNAYTGAMTKLTGRGGALPQAEKMRLLGAKTAKNINLALNDNDLLLNQNSDTDRTDLIADN